MLLARIQLAAGPEAGSTGYARVELRAENAAGAASAQRVVAYHPVPDPFRPGSATLAVAGPVPGTDAVLLAPCEPRVVLGMAHNTGPADRLLPPQAFHKSPHSVIGPGRAVELDPDQDAVDGEAELAVVIGSRASPVATLVSAPASERV